MQTDFNEINNQVWNQVRDRAVEKAICQVSDKARRQITTSRIWDILWGTYWEYTESILLERLNSTVNVSNVRENDIRLNKDTAGD
jgi:hypothetical protein